MRVKVGW